ncbi:MAG: divalent metal cation transporter, partial [Deltaproteobacteria bacterium]|nr:divalent metal cation transporter [Deltaproteobacteria bacterium]
MRWKAIGPGLLFAGAAVGVSHLVQSTRAGAGYGLALVIIVIAANILKYPAFSFGPRYAAATGCSLLEGYRRQGRWALWLYGALTLGTMFTVQAAVTFMTAGLVLAFTKAAIDPVIVTAAILALCVGILALGDYRWLDRIMKVVVAVLTVLTVAAALLVLPKVDWGTLSVVPEGVGTDMETVFFVAALVGWMPSAIDISVWHSLWSLARRRDTGYRPTVSDALFDFNVGYLGTAVLALCFVVLGAGVVYGSGREIPGSAGAFAAMVLDLYGQALGDWSRPLFGVTALMVMFSTTLTVVDGFPRAISALVARFGGAEDPERM